MQSTIDPSNKPDKRTDLFSYPKKTLAYASNHRKTTAAVATFMTVAVALPFAVQAATNNSSANDNHTNSRQTNTTINAETKPMPNQPDNASGQTKSQSSDGSSATTQVTVNGEIIEVPANGSYSKTTIAPGSETKVNVESSQQSSSTGSGGSTSDQSSSNIKLNVHSESNSSSSNTGSADE